MQDPTRRLPPRAAERLARLAAGVPASSLFTAADAAAARTAGLDPVGEVFGAVAINLGYGGGSCGGYVWQGSLPSPGFAAGAAYAARTTPVITTGDRAGSRNASGPYVRTVGHAWHGALARLRAEAEALGAHGVVAVVTRTTVREGRVREFTASGTAVRTNAPAGRNDPGPLWCTHLSVGDCAAAVLAGYRPRGMAWGMSVATKHEDFQVKRQMASYANTEVTGWTDVLTAARADAASRLRRDAERTDSHPSGDRVIVVQSVHAKTFETSCGEAADLHAESSMTGSVLEVSRSPGQARHSVQVVPVVPLDDPVRRRGRRSHDREGTW